MDVADLDFAVLDAVVLAHHEHVLLGLVGADGCVVDHHGVARLAAANLHACVESRYQRAIGVVKTRPHADRAGRDVEAVVDRDDRAGTGVAAFIGETQFNGHVFLASIAQVTQIGLFVDFERCVHR
ncbi:hypothetical protein D3C72_1993000 [compost metagenome]